MLDSLISFLKFLISLAVFLTIAGWLLGHKHISIRF